MFTFGINEQECSDLITLISFLGEKHPEDQPYFDTFVNILQRHKADWEDLRDVLGKDITEDELIKLVHG